MLKKDITYEDYNGQEVTEAFYFNFTKLELLEKDLEFGGLEETVKRLTETNNAKEAYGLFKVVVLDAYGKKSEDGKRFIKNAEIRSELENSPALAELIFEFIEHPERGAAFMEATLPAKLVAEVTAAQKEKDENTRAIQEATKSYSPSETAQKRPYEDYTRAELEALSNEEFQALLPSNPTEMTRPQLVEAMRRKNQE